MLAILFWLARRDWTVRFLVIGMLGAAGAFNLQAHTAIDAMAAMSGTQIGWWHSALLHGVGGVAYVFALVLFPAGSLDWAELLGPGPGGWVLVANLPYNLAASLVHTTASPGKHPA